MLKVSLTAEERDTIDRLCQKNLRKEDATLAVILFTRQHVRPKEELLDIVSMYPNLEDQASRAQAFEYLVTLGWVIKRDENNITFFSGVANLDKRIKDLIGDVSFRLPETNVEPGAFVRTVGSMNQIAAYADYANQLRAARNEILLPMLVTSPKVVVAEYLVERLRAGVKVRILLFSAKIVSQLRGKTFAATAAAAIKGWQEKLGGFENAEVRISHRRDDAHLCSCALIDNRVLRYDVYDPEKQRSLEGSLIHVEARAGAEPNLLKLFRLAFEDAWGRAEPKGGFQRLVWRFCVAWEWWLVIIFTIVSLWGSTNQVAIGIFGSVAASFFVSAIVKDAPRLWSWFRRPAQ